jgi:putative transposase
LLLLLKEAAARNHKTDGWSATSFHDAGRGRPLLYGRASQTLRQEEYHGDQGSERVQDKTTAINQPWQTDFTYLKIAGWGWYYPSTVLDDFSRYIVAWKLGPTMCSSDVTATLDQALAASGLDQITVVHRPRLLSDNGSSYVSSDLAG